MGGSDRGFTAEDSTRTVTLFRKLFESENKKNGGLQELLPYGIPDWNSIFFNLREDDKVPCFFLPLTINNEKKIKLIVLVSLIDKEREYFMSLLRKGQ